MSIISERPWIKHLMAIAIFIATALIYFYPTTFQGKVIGNQTDRIQSIARQHEVKEFSEKEGRAIYWTNAVFSGMPTTLIGHGHPDSYDYINLFTINTFRLFTHVTTPYALFFGGFLGMYILLLVFKTDWRLAIAGSIIYGLSTSHLLILEGGHFSKLQSVILCPPFLASLILLLRGKYLVGGVLLALFGSALLRTGHVQVIFYFALIMGLYALIKLINEIRSEIQITQVGTKIGFIVLAGVISFMPNLYRMWALNSYGEESIRGKTELVQEDKPSDGLDRDYVFSWSMGKIESMSVLIPNIRGATSGEAFVRDRDSESFKALMGNPNASQLAQFTRQYWGDQPFVGGAYYYGVVMIFLFITSLFLVNASWRWWSLGSLLIIFALGWGRNLGILNFFLFENIPPFNKFRAVNMIFILGHIIVVFLGIKGLDKILRQGRDKSWKAIRNGGAITAGLILMGWFLGFATGLEGPNDQILEGQSRFLEALRADRGALIKADALRAAFYLLVGFTLLWAWKKNFFKNRTVLWLVCLLAFIDIVTVNIRYVYPDKFVDQADFERIFAPRPVDKQILKDDDLHYRVFDLSSGDPFNNNISAYHHRLIGGYHPAKLRRYQEIIERYLGKPTEFPQVFNMLNTKYYIQNRGQGQPVVIDNDGALGNAWFVDKVKVVETANDEIAALASLDPSTTAVVHEKFVNEDMKMEFGSPSTASIELTNYIPDHLTYEYSAGTERMVVFSEIYYPEEKGWKVYIDGEERVDLKRANYVLNAAMVPAGEHTLELRFEPDGEMLMLSISRFGSILLTILFIYVVFVLIRSAQSNGWIDPSMIEEGKTRKNVQPESKSR